MEQQVTTPTFSLVIAVHDQLPEIQEQLPRLLAQAYDGFEVIVIDESSTDGTPDFLNEMKAADSRLRTSFVPQYHFRKDLRRLAFTIGVKAAKNKWIIFADIDKIPASETWLTEMAESIVGDTQLVIGYIKKNGDISLKTYEDISLANNGKARVESYELYNAAGVMVGHGTANGAAVNRLPLKQGNAAGVYILKIKDTEGRNRSFSVLIK